MIVKGTARASGGLGDHLLNAEKNETIELLAVHGMAAQDVHGCLREMDAMARGANAKKNIVHAHMSPDRPMTEAQWAHAWEAYEKEFGLQGRPYFEVEHTKANERAPHRHRVYNRIDAETGRAANYSFSRVRNEKVSRVLEHDLGHSLTLGKHNRQIMAQLRTEGRADVAQWMGAGGADTAARPEAHLRHSEAQQKARTGMDPKAIRAQVLAAWQEAATGRDLATALERRGLQLARGDKAGAVVVVDAAGGAHELGRAIRAAAKDAGDPMKLRAAEVKARLADLPPDTLPDVAGAEALQAQRTHARLHQLIDQAPKVAPNQTIDRQNEEQQTHERRTRERRKPHVAAVGTQPPPAARNRLRRMSELGVVRFPDQRAVLLPRDVHHDVEQRRTAANHALRRAARLDRTHQARQSWPTMQALADARKQAYKLYILAQRYGQELPPDVAQHLAWVCAREARPEIVVQLVDGGARIRDDGAAIRAQGTADQRAITVMIAMAKAKGWDRVNVTGSADFRRQAAEALTRAGVGVANAELAGIVQQTRAQMDAEELRTRLAQFRQARQQARPAPQEAPKDAPAPSAPPKASRPPAPAQAIPLRHEIDRYVSELDQLRDSREAAQAVAWAKQWQGPDGRWRDWTTRAHGSQLVMVRMTRDEATEHVETQRATRQPDWEKLRQQRAKHVAALETAQEELAALGFLARMGRPGAQIRARISDHQSAIDRAEIRLGHLDTAWEKAKPSAVASVLEEADRMRSKAVLGRDGAAAKLPDLDAAVQDREQLVKALREMDAAGIGTGTPSTASAGERDAHVRRQAEQWRQQQEKQAREEMERLRQQQEQQRDQGPRHPPRGPTFRGPGR